MELGGGYAVRLLAMSGMAVFSYIHPGFGHWGAVVLFALFQGIWPFLSVASNDLSASLAPFGEGPAMGLFNAVAAIASACGALAGGAIADNFGYSAVPLFAALTIMAALAIVRPQPRPTTSHPDEAIAAPNTVR